MPGFSCNHKSSLEWLHAQCRDTQRDENWLDGLDRRFVYTAERIDKLSNAIRSGFKGKVPGDVAVFTCGSYGRFEASPGSDVDLIVIINKPTSKITKNISLDYCKQMAVIENAVAKTIDDPFHGKDTPAWNDISFAKKYISESLFNDDIFRRWVPKDQILDNAFDEQDSTLRQIRRISLLFESQPLLNNKFSNSFRQKALQKLYGVKVDQSGMVIPAESWSLMVREVLRFSHLCHLFHHHKVHGQNKKPLIRTDKLFTTRRMLAWSVFLLLIEQRQGRDRIKDLFSSPVQRLCGLIETEMSAMKAKDHWPPSLRLLKEYAEALERIDFERTFDDAGLSTQLGASRSLGQWVTVMEALLHECLEFRNQHFGCDPKTWLGTMM